MTRLVRLELTRLRWRRAVLLLVAACVLVPAVVLGTHAWETRPVSDADLASAQEQLDRDLADPSYQRQVERCERNPDRFGIGADECAEMMGPSLDWYLYRPQLDVADTLDQQGVAVVVFLAGFLMLAATTFVGADWSSGSMSNQLLFEPRRSRVWAAKGLAVALFAGALAAVVLAAFWSTVRALVAARGLEVATAVWRDVQWTSLRGVLLVAAASLGAYAVTMLVRSTVFTLGALFATAVGSTIVLAALGIGGRWMPHTNVLAVLADGASYYRDPPPECYGRQVPAGLDCREYATLSLEQGVLHLGVLLVLAAALSVWSFGRRDVP